MRVGFGGTPDASIEVDHRRRRQRVELAGDRVRRREDDRDDQQADEADRQRRQDEVRDDVVDVGEAAVGAAFGAGGAHERRRLRANALQRRFALAQRGAGRVDGRGVAAPARGDHRLGGGPPRRVGGVEARLQRRVRRGIGAVAHPLAVHGAEQHRRRIEHVEHEHQHAEHEHDDLQRDLPVGAHQQRLPRFIHRPRGEVALHLALIRAEVRAEQEERRDRARPERVLVGQIEREVEGPQPAGLRRDAQSVADADAIRQPEHRGGDHREEPEDDQHHDLHVGPRHRLDAAEHRVDHRRRGDRQGRRRDVPAQHERQHHGRRRDDRATRHPARHQEQQAGEAARLEIEAALEVLVRGVDAGAVEERHQRQREDDHRDRQREVELDEAQAVRVALAGGADHRDRAELRRHHREAGGPPRNRSLGEEVAFELVAVARALDAVVDDPGDEADDDRPVNGMHAAS